MHDQKLKETAKKAEKPKPKPKLPEYHVEQKTIRNPLKGGEPDYVKNATINKGGEPDYIKMLKEQESKFNQL